MSKTMLSFLFFVALFILCACKIYANTHSKATQKSEQTSALASSARPHMADDREYVLEVIGLGVTLDKYRQ
jgi:outer membrane biogenesis lipoprotein LolB